MQRKLDPYLDRLLVLLEQRFDEVDSRGRSSHQSNTA